MLPTPYVKCDYDKIYEPSEDSFLFLDSLEKEQIWLSVKFKYSLTLVCEVGCGSGILTTFMMRNLIPNSCSLYMPTDVNPWAIQAMSTVSVQNHCENMYMTPVRMDLTAGLLDKCIDILVFNPPYVPADAVPSMPEGTDPQDKWLDLALEGGPEGMDVTNRLLGRLDRILSGNGVAYILFCARNKPEHVAELMRRKGWKVDLVEGRKAGWEVLSVYKFYRL
ncbi:HBR078Wp [Eremothecium sinecaudum]|uniref:HBR078Wp n=1 Tax=Eremothecium sinecaudum TaxID=45286 RepID=A0A120K132_9SACH|nr:HBR078Wp [Eremothecium sinecaudum]AMD18979.1 HBR078Wp [Eremothecium sinecaudum]